MIRIYKFSEQWRGYFEKEKAILLNALKGYKIDKVEHIGATSVVLCNTAGTIDLLLSIPSKMDMFTIKNILLRQGYLYNDSMSNNDVFLFYRKDKNNNVLSTIRLVEFASETYNNIKLFKFYLKEKDEHVIKYNEFRYSLATTCHGDYAEYEKGKKAYIESIIERNNSNN